MVVHRRFELEDAALERATGLPTLADVQWWVCLACFPGAAADSLKRGSQACGCGVGIVTFGEGDDAHDIDAGRLALEMLLVVSHALTRAGACVQMTLSDGSIKTFEVPMDRFSELRYNVAKVLQEMTQLERHPVLKLAFDLDKQKMDEAKKGSMPAGAGAGAGAGGDE